MTQPITKESIIEFLKTLPEDVSIKDIMYHLYVMEKIQEGEKDIEEGRTFTQEEVEAQIESWFK